MTSSEHTVKCHRCGRAIRSALSVARHYGTGCWSIVRKAARRINDLLAAFTRRQVESAIELIEDAAIVPGYDGTLHAVSSDGEEVYEVTAETCSCPASAECYHRAAYLMLAV